MLDKEDREIYSKIIKAVKLRDKYVVGGPSMHPLKQEATNPRSFSTLALNDLLVPSVVPEGAGTGEEVRPPSANATKSPGVRSGSPAKESNGPSPAKLPRRASEIGVTEKLPFRFACVGGVMEVYDVFDNVESDNGDSVNLFPVPSVDEFYDDMDFMFELRSSGPVQTFCFNRLQLLQTKFDLHGAVHASTEHNEMKSNCHRDFYNVRKIDTHIHHSAAMNAKFLLRFIRRKARFFSDDICMLGRDGSPVTLREVFQDLKVDPKDLSLDKLNVLADKTTLHRFDRFNAKYSPMGEPSLRTIFLKTDNYMGGRYLAEMTKELLKELEESKYQHTEWRLSIYGRDMKEWDKLANWVISNNLVSPNNRWMIQIPRLFNVYRSAGSIKNFQQMLDNIFLPLFEVMIDPSSHSSALWEFLNQVSGFDTVDDESKSPLPTDRRFSSRALIPEQWDLEDNPSYKYYSFYMYANIRVLNELRKLRKLRPFDYRPHAGEAGEIHHLDTAFLLADGVNHGINLRRSPALQYLFYITQIGLAISPCSNNQLFTSYEKNPFHMFFQRGMNVSLSTDDPLMFHQTREPLMEEYSIAKQVYRLSQADTCEIARNSVLQCGYSDEEKSHWLGSIDRWENDILKTNIPNIRIKFRHKTWLEEWLVLKGESEVMDSLVQFTTQHLLGSPAIMRQSMAPASPGHLAISGPDDIQLLDVIAEENNNLPPIPKSSEINLLANRKYAPNIPVSVALPWYISGAVIGATVAIITIELIKAQRH